MMDTSVDPDPDPDHDPEFVFPCMRCAQRVVLTETLMTGSNLCCYSKDVPCAYCFVKKDTCLPVPSELQSLVQKIVNLVDNLDVVGLSDHDRRILVERGLDLGKDLRVKWSAYQKKTKKCTLVDGSDDESKGEGKGEEWVAQQNSTFLELTKEAAASQERTNALLEQQNVLLSEQTALLQQLSESQSSQLGQLSDLMHRLISDQAKYSHEMLSQLQLNVSPVPPRPTEGPATSLNSKPPFSKPVFSHSTPTSPKSEVSHLLDTFVGKTRKRMNSSSSSSFGKRAQNRSCTG